MDKQKQRLIDLAPTALEIEVIGMVQDPEDENCMCNAEGVDLEPTSWDVFMKVPLDGDEWDGEDCTFEDYDSAYSFGLELESITPNDVMLQVD